MLIVTGQDLDLHFQKHWDLKFCESNKSDINENVFARALVDGHGFPKECCVLGTKIRDFLRDTKSLSLDNMTKEEDEEEEWTDVRHALETGASLKKRHEVVKMAPIVNKLAKRCKAETVFDIGSGQGHLYVHIHVVSKTNS